MTNGRVVTIGDSCVAVQFAAAIDASVNARCIALAASLDERAFPGIRDVVPTYNAVTLHFDPLHTDRPALYAALESAARAEAITSHQEARTIEIPVKYGAEHGPDLPAVAEFAKCSESEVARLHSSIVYRVYMLGFLPGFAYMGAVDPRIAMPRLETPRLRVEAGSVGIAGAQTGIYPFDSPGGWRIVGRTTVKPFDPSRPQPFLLKPGDHVKFVAV
jgi:KipI family sensor histidine kinase inhibitor